MATVALRSEFNHLERGTRRIRHHLKQGITQTEIKRALRISSWPQRPFYRVAAQLGLAKVDETYVSEFDKVRKSVEQIELLTNPGATLSAEIN